MVVEGVLTYVDGPLFRRFPGHNRPASVLAEVALKRSSLSPPTCHPPVNMQRSWAPLNRDGSLITLINSHVGHADCCYQDAFFSIV